MKPLYIEAFVPAREEPMRFASATLGEQPSLEEARAAWVQANKPNPYKVVRIRAPQWRVYITAGTPKFSWGGRVPDLLYEGYDPGEAWDTFEAHSNMLVYDL